MRNIVIERITEYLRLYTYLMTELDIAPDELENLSNMDLVYLLEEIVEILCTDEPECDI